jgi:putative transposase
MNSEIWWQPVWTFPECRTIHELDVNAAINLKNMAATSAVSACGEEGSAQRRKTLGETSLCETGSQL